jgi:hypothetical protein
MKSVKDVLIAAKELIEKTGWCRTHYAIKNGKPLYEWTKEELADAYDLDGAMYKVTYGFMRQDERQQGNQLVEEYSKLAHTALYLVVELDGWTGIYAEWSDRDPAQDQLNVFIADLKSKKTPRDKAKVEINKFKTELQKKKIEPLVSKEIVLKAIGKAIDFLTE